MASGRRPSKRMTSSSKTTTSKWNRGPTRIRSLKIIFWLQNTCACHALSSDPEVELIPFRLTWVRDWIRPVSRMPRSAFSSEFSLDLLPSGSIETAKKRFEAIVQFENQSTKINPERRRSAVDQWSEWSAKPVAVQQRQNPILRRWRIRRRNRWRHRTRIANARFQ